MNYELKIVNATVIDGSGAPARTGEIGIKDGKIAALFEAPGEAAEIIDAGGQVVCPGFVDVHTHYDAQVNWDRMLSVSPWHGVTTVVMGNCGFGVAPTKPEDRIKMMRTLEKVEGMSLDSMQEGLGSEWPFTTFPEYLDALEAQGLAINAAVFVGHTPIRLYVMGEESMQREASEDEIEQMTGLVKEAMDAGALGFASAQVELHFAYDGNKTPSRLATLDEIDTLVGAVAESGGGMIQFAPGQNLTIEFMGKLWDKHKQPISWSALLADSPTIDGHVAKMEESLAERARGAKITPQVSGRALQFEFNFLEPYPFGAASNWVPRFAEAMAGDKDTKLEIYNDAEFRDQFDALNGPNHVIYTGWQDRMVVSLNPLDPDSEAMLVTEAAQRANKRVVDYILDLSIETDFKARFRMAAVNYDADKVAALLDYADDAAVIALSDAGAHADQLCDACYSTDLLGKWVREKGVMPLERAVKMLTRHPAEVFGIKDRGRIDPGCPADLVIFDPDTVGATELKRVFDQPGNADRLVSEAEGISYVIVNGTVLRKDNQAMLGDNDELPGKLLRRGTGS